MMLIAGDSHTAALHAGLMHLDPATRKILDRHFGPVKLRTIMPGADAYGQFFQVCPDGISMRDPIAENFAALTDGAGIIYPQATTECSVFPSGCIIFAASTEICSVSVRDGCATVWSSA